MRFDLANAFVAMGEQRFVPYRIERSRARFQRDLFGERTNRALAPGLVADIDGRRLAPRALHRTADAAERIEIMIDGGDTELDGIDVLVGRIDAGQDMAEQRVAANRAAVRAVG